MAGTDKCESLSCPWVFPQYVRICQIANKEHSAVALVAGIVATNAQSSKNYLKAEENTPVLYRKRSNLDTPIGKYSFVEYTTYNFSFLDSKFLELNDCDFKHTKHEDEVSLQPPDSATRIHNPCFKLVSARNESKQCIPFTVHIIIFATL